MTEITNNIYPGETWLLLLLNCSDEARKLGHRTRTRTSERIRGIVHTQELVGENTASALCFMSLAIFLGDHDERRVGTCLGNSVCGCTIRVDTQYYL